VPPQLSYYHVGTLVFPKDTPVLNFPNRSILNFIIKFIQVQFNTVEALRQPESGSTCKNPPKILLSPESNFVHQVAGIFTSSVKNNFIKRTFYRKKRNKNHFQDGNM